MIKVYWVQAGAARLGVAVKTYGDVALVRARVRAPLVGRFVDVAALDLLLGPLLLAEVARADRPAHGCGGTVVLEAEEGRVVGHPEGCACDR